ncbi:MAG: class I SAM-dependent methyltransferase [Burkholderiales bacterium]|nr:class I SAM-dependent methyltransferase [Burkholderiales bacterium]
MSAAAFDAIAVDYDRSFTHSLVGTAQRRVVWQALDEALRQHGRPCAVLELNCGTGEDALHMARAGHRVVATDVSREMLRMAEAKFERGGVGQLARVQRLDLRMLAAGQVTREDLGGPFDVVLSNFGGLNCLSPEQLRGLAAQLVGCLSEQGRVIAVVMPRLCLWESVWALVHLQPRLAARRWGGGPIEARLGLGQPSLPVWYYGAADMDNAFRAHFYRERVRPVGLAVPPSYFESLAQRAPRWLALMAWLDRRWFTAAWGARLSDHMLVQWCKR